MSNERRPLIEGLKPPPPEQRAAEEAFVFGGTRNVTAEAGPRPIPSKVPESIAEARPGLLPQMYNRVPITTRARPEMARALKRASLQRQLEGAEPFHVQDIMEVALETWLRDKGYLE